MTGLASGWKRTLRATAAGCVAAALVLAGPALVASGPRAGADDDRMADIVAALRVQEARYRRIGYVARSVIRDEGRRVRANSAEVTTLATRRVILQDDRHYLRYEAFERFPDIKFRWEMVSAYDGQRTRTVNASNCANVHRGRFIHPDIVPAHSTLGVRLRRGRVAKDDGGRDGVFALRPHNFVLRDFWIFSPLADLLTSPRHDKIGQSTLQFRYWHGECRRPPMLQGPGRLRTGRHPPDLAARAVPGD